MVFKFFSKLFISFGVAARQVEEISIVISNVNMITFFRFFFSIFYAPFNFYINLFALNSGVSCRICGFKISYPFDKKHIASNVRSSLEKVLIS